ncbi:MAG: hypothetical protein JO148_03700 [Acidimicrobiia bacterium]|nr:hypothetical protein [Acidimicrobiia bacterium]
MSTRRFALPRPPEDPRKRRLILASAGFIALAAVGLALHGGSTPTDADQVAPPTVPTTAVPLPTTTTVDPKAVQAGVAALWASAGPTAQQLASVPASTSSHSSSHHGKGGSHSHH